MRLLGSLCTCVVFFLVLCIIPYANTPVEEERRPINRAFILKGNGVFSRLLLLDLGFFSYLLLNHEQDHLQESSITLLNLLPVALVLVSISDANSSASPPPPSEQPAHILYFLYFPCLLRPPTAVKSAPLPQKNKNKNPPTPQFRGAF